MRRQEATIHTMNHAPLVRTGLRYAILVSLTLPLLACSARYFHDAGPAPMPPPRHALAQLPQPEQWSGYVFNGQKTGFSRLRVVPAAGHFRIESEAVLALKFLGFSKTYRFVTVDVVNSDLSLIELDHVLHIDDSRQQVRGQIEGTALRVTTVTGDDIRHERLALPGPIYPASAVALYPVLHGLEVGREYRYTVYDSQTRGLAPAQQTVVAYEASDLFDGQAFKIETRLHGQRVDTWIDTHGRIRLELALGGVLISSAESEAAAKRYLALASVNKKDAMLDFSLVRSDRPLRTPRELAQLRVALSGLGSVVPPQSAFQHCTPHGDEWVCDIRRASAEPTAALRPTPSDDRLTAYLQPSIPVPSDDPHLRHLAAEIAGTPHPPSAQITLLLAWLNQHIRKEPIDAFSALDVLQARRAECQGHAYLYTAFARALGIPTRVVNGLVYSPERNGFLYHSWTESWLDGVWLPIDPTFAQFGADATHIKLAEGENLADLLPLTELLGKLKLRILDAEPAR